MNRSGAKTQFSKRGISDDEHKQVIIPKSEAPRHNQPKNNNTQIIIFLTRQNSDLNSNTNSPAQKTPKSLFFTKFNNLLIGNF